MSMWQPTVWSWKSPVIHSEIKVRFLEPFFTFFCFRVLLLKKFLRRVHKYPVYVPPETSMPASVNGNGGVISNGYSMSGSGPGAARHLYELFNGHRHYDEICCKTGMSAAQLDELIENDPDVFVLRK